MRASTRKTTSDAREPVAQTTRLSFGVSGLRKGEQTIWTTRQARSRVLGLVGEAISEQIRRHHRRRLRRLGWEHALQSETIAWARGEPSPRAGNAVDVLIDGADALPVIANELAAARRAATAVEAARAGACDRLIGRGLMEDSAPLRRAVTFITDSDETQAGLRLRLAVVEAAIERVSSDRLGYAELIRDLEELRVRLLAAVDELSED